QLRPSYGELGKHAERCARGRRIAVRWASRGRRRDVRRRAVALVQRDDVVLADAAVKGNEPHLEERGGVTLPPSFLPRRTRGGWRQILLLFTAFGAAACSSRAPADHRGIDPGSGGEDNCRLPVEHSSLRRPLWTLIVTDSEWERLHAK